MSMLPFPDEDAPGLAPMEAKLVDALPSGGSWQFEPKWDGFRCIAWRDGGKVALRSRSDKPLGRYFPEIVAMIAALPERGFVLDGELVVPIGDTLSFSALQARLHPAESRVARLAAETPAQFVTFDCLAVGDRTLIDMPFAERRRALESFHDANGAAGLILSPATSEEAVARAWLAGAGGALDGIVAKRLDLMYRAGERAMAKLKQHRTADCVVGGFRYAAGSKRAIGSLLLGLHDGAGRLDHVGFTSGIDAAEKVGLLDRLEPLIEAPGFTGNAPGGPSRWATARSAEWQPLRPELVVEVRYDQVTDGRFRHGTTLLRWRPDKAPAECTKDQLARELRPDELEELLSAYGRTSHGGGAV